MYSHPIPSPPDLARATKIHFFFFLSSFFFTDAADSKPRCSPHTGCSSSTLASGLRSEYYSLPSTGSSRVRLQPNRAAHQQLSLYPYSTEDPYTGEERGPEVETMSRELGGDSLIRYKLRTLTSLSFFLISLSLSLSALPAPSRGCRREVLRTLVNTSRLGSGESRPRRWNMLQGTDHGTLRLPSPNTRRAASRGTSGTASAPGRCHVTRIAVCAYCRARSRRAARILLAAVYPMWYLTVRDVAGTMPKGTANCA